MPPAGERAVSTGEVWLSAIVLTFALLVIVGCIAMRLRQVIGGDTTFKLVGLVFVIGAALFLITAGYSLEQVTPVMGLLGTALGFVFGKAMPDATASTPGRSEPHHAR